MLDSRSFLSDLTIAECAARAAQIDNSTRNPRLAARLPVGPGKVTASGFELPFFGYTMLGRIPCYGLSLRAEYTPRQGGTLISTHAFVRASGLIPALWVFAFGPAAFAAIFAFGSGGFDGGLLGVLVRLAAVLTCGALGTLYVFRLQKRNAQAIVRNDAVARFMRDFFDAVPL